MAHLVNDPRNPRPDDIWPVLDIIAMNDWGLMRVLAAAAGKSIAFIIHVRMALADDPHIEKVSRYIRVDPIYDKYKGSVRYRISKERLKTITDSLESIVLSLGGDCVLMNNPNFHKFIMRHAPDSLRYTVDDIPEGQDEFAEDAAPMCTLNIGFTVAHSRAIVRMLAAESTTFGLHSMVATNIANDIETDIMSFYVNCLLSLVPPTVHAKVIERMKPLALAGMVNLKRVSKADYQACQATHISVEKVMLCALMVATSYKKRGESVSHLTDWCKKQSMEMFARAERKSIGVAPPFINEVLKVADYMFLQKKVCFALLDPLLEKRKDQQVMNDVFKAVWYQIKAFHSSLG